MVLLQYLNRSDPALLSGIFALVFYPSVTAIGEDVQSRRREARAKPPRPLITLDAYDGESTWDEWIGHFNSVSRVNDWNNQAKLLWLEVRLVGKTRKAWNRLTTEEKSTYTTQQWQLSVDALSRRVSKTPTLPSSRHMGRSLMNPGETLQIIYVVWQIRHFRIWMRPQRRNDRFLGLLGKPDVALAIRQCRPRTLNDAVTATLEIEAFLSMGNQTHRADYVNRREP